MRKLLLITAVLSVAAAACELALTFDRSLILEDAGEFDASLGGADDSGTSFGDAPLSGQDASDGTTHGRDTGPDSGAFGLGKPSR